MSSVKTSSRTSYNLKSRFMRLEMYERFSYNLKFRTLELKIYERPELGWPHLSKKIKKETAHKYPGVR